MHQKWFSNWFSNMLPLDRPFNYQGIEFRTVENFYQAMKVEKDDIAMRARIAALEPHKSKTAARRVKLRSDWNVIKLSVMEFGLRQKFAPGTTWQRKLLATGGEIIEANNWHDNFWGDCRCERPACVAHGENQLGKLLMKLRAESLSNRSPTAIGTSRYNEKH